VRGANHERAGLPNQDAIYWFPEYGEEQTLILVLSDGHGSAKYFRSAQGAAAAVQTAARVISEFHGGQVTGVSLSGVKRLAEERLPQDLVRAWEQHVRRHLYEYPFTETEWKRLCQHEDDGMLIRQAIENTPTMAYGATVLAVLVTPAFILYLQLGDGDILTVSETGEVSRPLQRDERLFGNETTSLCSPEAWHDFQVRFQTIEPTSPETIPALILASTDGYINSFRNEEGFLQVGTDLLDMIRTDGLDEINNRLETWLHEASKAGSGDDVTLGILCRAPMTKEALPYESTA
jgi:serine/threonine protein phosphatase PrpC